MHRAKTDKENLINDNSDIYSSCKCGSRFHKFIRKKDVEKTLRTRSTQKKSTLRRKSVPKRRKKPKKSRSSFGSISTTQSSPCSTQNCCLSPPCPSSVGSASTSCSEEPASPSQVTPFFFYLKQMCLDFLIEALLLTPPISS